MTENMPLEPMPEFTIPSSMAGVFAKTGVGEKLNITAGYEVIQKDEYGVRIRLTGIYTKDKNKMLRRSYA